MGNSLSLKQTAFVAAYLGEANGNATEAARIAGYKGNDDTLKVVGHENITKPYIADLILNAKATVMERGIAVKQNRIDALDERWRLLQQIIAERAADPDMQHIPGGKTGLLVHTTKAIGVGQSQQIIDEYTIDAVLLREAREHEK